MYRVGHAMHTRNYLFCGVVVLDLLLRTYHRTSSIVATASSTEECPTVPSPDWIVLPRCSRTLPGIIEHWGYYETLN